MVTYIPGDNSLGEAFQQAGSNFAKSYMNRADEVALQNAITKLSPSASPREILDAITGVNTYSPEAKQNAIKNYIGVAQFEENKRQAQAQEAINNSKNETLKAKEQHEIDQVNDERRRVRQLTNQLDIPEQQKEALAESASLDVVEDLLKKQLTPKEGTFDKKLADKNAEIYSKLVSDEIPKLETTLNDIEYAKKLSKDLGEGVFSGPIGMVSSATGFSETAKNLENVSFALMEPIVKIFNPSGPIAQQKLKMIIDKYVIKPGDAPWTRRAKLDTLERFAKQGLSRAQKKIDLIQRYQGVPPESVMQEFERESDTISSAMIDYDLIGEEAKDEKLPNPADFKGKTITSPEGKKYKSDGTRWVNK